MTQKKRPEVPLGTKRKDRGTRRNEIRKIREIEARVDRADERTVTTGVAR